MLVPHNAVVVWNTLRTDEVDAPLRAEGQVITDEELARTSLPLHASTNLERIRCG